MHPPFRRPGPLVAAILVLTVGASAGRTDRVGGPTGETWTSPVLGRPYRAFRDPATGAKWLEDDDGRRFESMADAVLAEEASVPAADRALAPELRERADDPEFADERVDVILRLARQPLAEAADIVRARQGDEPATALRSVREILSDLAVRRDEAGAPPDPASDEAIYLTPSEREHLRALRKRVGELRRGFRKDVLDLARPVALADQEPVVDLLRSRGAIVLGRSVILSAVAARVRYGDLRGLVRDLPGLARIAPAGKRSVEMNVSAPVTGAPTWWTAGFDGSSSTKVAVLDTGIDSSHPAFSRGVVTDEGVFLSSGAQDPYFADDDTTTDDLQFHGTHVGGTVASNDSTYRGMAPGCALMNAKCGYKWQSGSQSGGALQDADIMEAGDWAATNGADVFNCSFGGGGTTDGASDLTHFFDACVADLGISVAISAGNSGSSSGTVGIPGDGFNVVTVGNFNDNGTTGLSDDSLASSSSRGPLSDGRRKPDISAPGTNITSAYAFWEGTTGDFVSASGTSMASPHVAGALALLLDGAVASAPESLRALLVTNAANTSPSPTSPDNAWGHGGIDLTATYTNRAGLVEGTLTSSGSRTVFLKGASLASGKRVTLAWNRRVVSNTTSAPTTYSSLLDLDLSVWDESGGTSLGVSESSLNSSEQVKTSAAATTPVVKVLRYPASFPSGLTTQPWSVAVEATTALSTVDPPVIACAFTAGPTQVAGSTDSTVTVSVANSGGLAAQAPAVTLTLPSGYTVVSGSNPQTVSAVAAGGTGTATWTVRSGTGPSGTKSISAAASSSSYGETFTTTTVSSSHTLDVDAPSGSVTIAGGAATTTSPSVTLALSSSDTLAGVASMRIRQTGGAWGEWGRYETTAAIELTGTDGTKTVDAEFRDGVGNVSGVASDTIVLDRAPPLGTIVLAGGATWTNSPTASVTVSASDATSGVTDMQFSDDGQMWSSWEPYATSATRTLPGYDGTKTVYARFRDAAGNVSVAASDAVGLDRVAPTAGVTVASGAVWTTSPSVTLAPSGSDDRSGVAEMRFSNDGTTWSSWAAYATSAPWTLEGADGTKTVHVQVRDVAGNVSTSSSSDTIGLDTTAPTATVTVNSGAAWTTTPSVTLTVSGSDATSGVAVMRFSNDGTTWSSWEAFATSAPWTLEGADGTKTVHVQVRDVAGNVSTTSSTDTIGLDTVAPTATVTVNSGAAWTKTPSVTLTVSGSDATSGVAEMRFSNDGTTWSSWAAFATSAPWTLEGADGSKTVHVQVRDVAGNVSTTSSTDTIGLDTVAPAATVTVNSGAAWTATPSVTLTVSGSDATSGVAEMRFSNDGTTWSSWAAYATSAPWTLEGADGTKTVHVQVRDVAGNVSTSASSTDTIGLDTVAPAAAVTVNSGAAWTTTPSVTLTVSGSDATSGVSEMRFSNDGTTWSSWAAYATSAPWTLEGADGTKTVYVQVRDVAGNVSTSSSSDTIGLDTVVPTATVTVNSGAAWTTTPSVTLTVSGSDATSGVAEMRFSNDGETWSSWEAYATSAPWSLEGADGTRTVHVQVRDTAGNVSTASSTDTIGLDTVAPTGTVSVNSGAAWTTTPSVTLTVSGSDATSGVAEMRFSNDGTTWSSWEAFATSAPWSLAGADGTATVFVQTRDVAGNVSSSSTDAIGLDMTAPSLSLTIDGGAAWTGSAAVTLAPSGSDATSGVVEMRFSDDGTNWSAWAALASSAPWTLPGADGTNAVFAQVRDVAGNVSAVAGDAIGLDRAAPGGTIVVADGAVAVNVTDVGLGLTWSDATAGVDAVRFSGDGTTWTEWEAPSAERAWDIGAGDGPRTVRAQFRDLAGNLSDVVSDDVLADFTAPAGTMTLADGALYLGPGAALVAGTESSDGEGGSGVAEFRWSHDGGTNWSAWTVIGDGAIDVGHPGGAGDVLHSVAGQFRDVAGNESEVATSTVRLLPTVPQDTTLAASVRGALDASGDVDAYRIDLLAGDRLDATVASKAATRGAKVPIAIDVWDSGGTKLQEGLGTGKKSAVRAFVAPETGSYLIVLRGTGEAAPAGATYTFGTSVRGVRMAPVSGAADAGPVDIAFAGNGGRRVAGRITGPVVASAVISGPGGTLPVVLKGKNVKWSLLSTELTLGPGAYSLHLDPATDGSVKWRLALSAARRAKSVAEGAATAN